MNLKDYFDWNAKAADSCWAGCASLEDAMKECKNLRMLSCLWQTAQGLEIDAQEKTYPNLALAKVSGLTFSKTFARSFCVDGFLKEEGTAGVPVLFICRESNISGNIDGPTLELGPDGVGDDGQDKGDNSLFWLREVVKCKEKDPHDYFPSGGKLSSSEKGAQTKYYNCLSQLLDRLKEDEELIGADEKLIDKKKKLSDCAYLNINKRGGFADCDLTRLATYAQRYQVFIQKEIQLINPEKIVVCGELKDQCLQDTLEEIFRNCGKKNYWVYPKHPSRYTTEAFKNIVKYPVNREKMRI